VCRIQLAHHYIISTGGQSERSDGIYLRQNYGDSEHELGVAVGPRRWKVSFHLALGSKTHVALTFRQSAGLKAYVDGHMVATDVRGSDRFYVRIDYDQFADIRVGQSNAMPLDPSWPGAAVWNLNHNDTIYSDADIASLSGKINSSIADLMSIIYRRNSTSGLTEGSRTYYDISLL